jgi:hypothetical protein
MDLIATDIKITIIFRSCDSVNAVNNAQRPFDLDKKTLIKICFKSLYNSVQGFNYRIIVLGDKLSNEMKTFFLEYGVDLVDGVYGNDNSILESFRIAEKIEDDQWIYFCEDDYLHQKNSFDKIVNLLKSKDAIIPGRIQFKQLLRKKTITFLSFNRYFSKPNLVVHPCDYPDRYNINYLSRNYIFHTQDSHWRQITDTTFTFLMEARDVKKYKKILIKSSNRANDRYLSKKLFGRQFFFNKLLCVSPIPSIATHMHISTMSPVIVWQSLVNELLGEI